MRGGTRQREDFCVTRQVACIDYGTRKEGASVTVGDSLVTVSLVPRFMRLFFLERPEAGDGAALKRLCVMVGVGGSCTAQKRGLTWLPAEKTLTAFEPFFGTSGAVRQRFFYSFLLRCSARSSAQRVNRYFFLSLRPKRVLPFSARVVSTSTSTLVLIVQMYSHAEEEHTDAVVAVMKIPRAASRCSWYVVPQPRPCFCAASKCSRRCESPDTSALGHSMMCIVHCVSLNFNGRIRLGREKGHYWAATVLYLAVL